MSAVPHVLSIDLGTGGSKVALVGVDGSVAAAATRPVEARRIPPDGAEQDPEAVWGAVADAVRWCGRAAFQSGAGTQIGAGSVIGREAEIGERVRIGAGVVVDAGAVIPDDAVVLPYSQVTSRSAGFGVSATLGHVTAQGDLRGRLRAF